MSPCVITVTPTAFQEREVATLSKLDNNRKDQPKCCPVLSFTPSVSATVTPSAGRV